MACATKPQPAASGPAGAAQEAAAEGPSGAQSNPGSPAGACGATKLASYAELQPNPKFPDPFRALDGSRITRKDQWACRRAEIGAQFEEYQLGPKPPRPSVLNARVAGGELEVSAGDGQKSISFTVEIALPAKGQAPYPALIMYGNRPGLDNDALAELGVALIKFPNSELAEQQNGQSRGRGSFYTLYGSEHPASAMMAWAWGVSRLIDVLEATPAAQIDPKRLGVTGCSRNGKGALVAGAFDERIALTIPQESGAGGSASWRVSDLQHADWIAAGSPDKQDIQTLHQITKENVWFRSSFSQFDNTVDKLPMDQHMLYGMVAPRALLVVENTSMYWLGKLSTFTNSLVAHRIWQALGVPERMGYSQIGEHEHCKFPASQLPELTAYVQKFLIGGGSGDTHVLKTDGGFTLDEARWVDWTTPVLQ
jgi:hypothetical protein